jgi:hypothetical protein
MARTPKYQRGKPFKSLVSLVTWLETGGWCFLRASRRPKHPQVLRQWSLDLLSRYVRGGAVSPAVARDPRFE